MIFNIFTYIIERYNFSKKFGRKICMIIMLDEESDENEIEKGDTPLIQKISDFLDKIDLEDFSDDDEAQNSQKTHEIKTRKTEFSLKSLFASF